FSSENAINGSVTSLGDTGSLIFGTSGISMWKENVDPAENDSEPSGLSPIQFRSNARLRTYAADIFAFRTLTGTTNTNQIDFIFGAKTGRIKTTQSQGFSERAFVFDYFQSGVHLNNVITLGSDAEAEFVGTGPLVGIQWQTRLRRFGIAAGITEASMI